MEKVLITGAGGFIGRHVYRAFAGDPGYETVGLLRTGGGPSFLCCDVLDRGSVRDVLARVRPDILVHCAWYVRPEDYLTSGENVAFLKAGLDLYEDFYGAGGKRAVFVGTCFEYGVYDRLLPEDAFLAPKTLYACCKAGLGGVLTEKSRLDGVDFCWARLFYLYGEGENKTRVVPYIINGLLRGESPECSVGRQRRDYVYIDDAAAALKLIAQSGKGVYNVGTGEAVAFTDIYGALEGILGGRVLRVRDSSGEPACIQADVRRLEALGWARRYSLAQGMERAVEWWRREAE
ncbi:MAG: NAD(P)-dependent oxidoreductase [Peptococcaceae bacterium]|jgi:nucleoside-diphosphate-sugar epimerase|nr:NAD(P)-dependent oxidoreductase [Peptococcaceae bacterium]